MERSDDDDLTPEQEAALEAWLRAAWHPDPATAARRQEEAARRLPALLPRRAVARAEARVLADLWARVLGIPERMKGRIPDLSPADMAVLRRLILEALPGGNEPGPDNAARGD